MTQLRVKISGFQRLEAKLRNLPQRAKDELDGELEAAADAIELGAKQRVPVNFGQIINSITSADGNEYLHKEVTVRNVSVKGKSIPLGAYLEFGTGVQAAPPPGLEDYAMRFFVSGRGRLPPAPFLFPAVEAERVLLAERLTQMLKRVMNEKS